jgi:WD40 repeat protein
VDFQGTVELWDVAGSRRRTLSERPFARDAAFLPGGTLVVAAGKDLAIYEPLSHELARRLPTGLQEVRRLAVSPDGASLAAADEAIEVWDVRSLALRLHLAGHGDETRALAFRQDGRTLASAGADTALRVWDTGSGLELLGLGGFGGVTSLEFSPDWLELHVLHVAPAGREVSLLRAVHPERASLPEGYASRRPTSGKGRP